jgi:hypothetical protein
MLRNILLLLFGLGLCCFAQSANWTGPYELCRNSGELKHSGHLRIGVRYDISDRLIVHEFQQAFAFWARVLDVEFYDDQSTSCAMAIVAGTPELLSGMAVARAHLPDRANFQGWIAVDPKASTYLSIGEAIGIWSHEIGHLLGLKHSLSPSSLMYFIDVDSTCTLDAADLRALSRLHGLRGGAPAPYALWAQTASDVRANRSSRQ